MASGVSEANEAQRQRPGVQGQCPGGDSEPDKVIFNVYNICILCNYWTSVIVVYQTIIIKQCVKNMWINIAVSRRQTTGAWEYTFVKVYLIVFVPFIELRLDLIQITNITHYKKKKKKKKKLCRAEIVFFGVFLCRAEIVSAGRPRPAPPTVATTLGV